MKMPTLPDSVIDALVERSIKIGHPLTHEAVRALASEIHAVSVDVRQHFRDNPRD